MEIGRLNARVEVNLREGGHQCETLIPLKDYWRGTELTSSGRGTGTAIMEAKLLMQLHYRSAVPLYMVFIDLKKAYDTLDRPRAMRILKAYGVGPNLCRLIEKVWAGDTLVLRQSGFFGKPFRARRGVRQGDIMSPLIFNIMVDAVVRHWRHQKVSGEEQESSLFYADDGLCAGTEVADVQLTVDVLTKGFASIGLKMNAKKTEFMVATSGGGRTNMSDAAYNRMITGEGHSFRERRGEKILCEFCGKEVTRGSMPYHQKTSKRCKDSRRLFTPSPAQLERIRRETLDDAPVEREPATYCVNIPLGSNISVNCPVDDCARVIEGKTFQSIRTATCSHFNYRHPLDTIAIDGNILPQCRKCDLFGKNVLTPKHLSSGTCKKGQIRKMKRQQARVNEAAREESFTINGTPINRVGQFKYLGRVLEEADNDSHAIDRQLTRARLKWGRVGKVLSSQGAEPRVMGYFYKAIVQSVLLYGSESWVISIHQKQQLNSFHNRVARYITGRHIRELDDGSYYCPPTSEVLEAAGLYPLETYIERRRQTVTAQVTTRPIYERCTSSKPFHSGARRRKVWWNNVTI